MGPTNILTVVFFILLLIVFGFALLTYIPQIRQFLLKNPKSRRGGLFLLAIFPFLTGLLLSSRLMAEAQFVLVESVYSNPMYSWFLSSQPDWNLVIQNKASILNELWIKILFPFLSGGRCPYSDPDLCKYVGLEGGLDLSSYAVIYTLALIPALITFGLGWLLTRKKSHADS